MALQIPILTSFTFIKDQIFNRKQIIHAPSTVMPWLTLYGRFPRTTLLPLLLSVNHFHAAQLSLVAAAAFGNLCPSQTVVIGSDIHM
jgi:hypothetical protein